MQQDGDLGEDILADDDERGAGAARGGERNDRDDRWIGHAEDDVRPRRRGGCARRGGEVGEVVQGAKREHPARECRRIDAHDVDSLVHRPSRFRARGGEAAGDHRDRVVACEIGAQLREELARRLDSGPVVLVEDEQAGAGRQERQARSVSGMPFSRGIVAPRAQR